MTVTQEDITAYDRRVELSGRSLCNDYVSEVIYGHTRTIRSLIDRRVKPKPVVLYPTTVPPQMTAVCKYLVFDSFGADYCQYYHGYSAPDFNRATVDPSAEVFPIPASRVVEKWRNKVKGMKFCAADYVAELKETAGMAIDGVQNVLRAVRAARSRQYAKALRSLLGVRGNKRLSLRSVPATWLVANFGLAPVISDLGSALTQLGEKELGDLLIRVTAVDEAEFSDTDTRTYWNCNYTASSEAYRKDTAVGYVRLTPSWNAYTLGNPLESIWEGVPLSWVADYFTNVGDYLSQLDALDGIEVVAGSITSREVGSRVFTPIGYSYTHVNHQWGSTIQNGSYNYRKTWRNTSSFSLEAPVLRYEPSPTIRHFANLAAVLATKILR